MFRSAHALLGVALALTLGACSKPDSAPERTEPWPAPATKQREAAVLARYSVAPGSELTLALRAREAKLTGGLSVVTGQMQVDLLDLTQTRGTVRVDVASVKMEAPDDEAETRRQTSEARNWLDLGSNQPEAERERKRWAEFLITAVETEGATAAHEGKRRRLARPAPEDAVPQAGEPAASGVAEPTTRPETREVRLKARGDLTFHGYRVEHTLRLLARFHYPGPAGPDVPPSKIEVESRGPLIVSLAAHDIKPRDAAGTFVSSGVKLLGIRVGREARVSIRLVALPAP